SCDNPQINLLDGIYPDEAATRYLYTHSSKHSLLQALHYYYTFFIFAGLRSPSYVFFIRFSFPRRLHFSVQASISIGNQPGTRIIIPHNESGIANLCWSALESVVLI